MKRFLSRWFGPAPRPTRKSSRPRLRLEELESRTLLAVTAHFEGTQLVVQGDDSGNMIWVDVVGSGEFAKQRIMYFQSPSWIEVGRFAGYGSIRMDSGGGNDNVTIASVLYDNPPITINGDDGNDVVNLNDFPRHSPVNILNTRGHTWLRVTDPLGNSESRTVTVGQNSLTLAHPPFDDTFVVNYTDLSLLEITLGNAGNTVTVNNTPPVFTKVHTGTGSNSVSVKGTTGELAIDGHGQDSVVVGDAGRLTNILGPVSVENLSGRLGLTVDNQADPGSRTVTLGPAQLSFGGPAISYAPGTLNSMLLRGGTGTSTYTVTGTPRVSTGVIVLETRGNGDLVRVLGNTSELVIGGFAPNRVEIGDNGLLSNILRDISVSNRFNSRDTDVVIDDSADTTGRGVSINGGVVSYGNPNAVLRLGNLRSLQLKGGAGGSTYTVTATPDAPGGVLVETRGNGDRVRVLANSAPLTIAGFAPNRVEVGDNGRLTNIFRDVIVTNTATATDLVSDDSADTTGRSVEITGTTVSYGNPNAVLRYSNVSNLTVNGGSGSDTFFVFGTPAGTSTSLNGGAVDPSRFDQFVVHADSNALFGPLALHGKPGTNSFVEYYDFANPAAQTYTFTTNTVSRSGLAPVTFDNLNQVVFYAASVGGNTINVPSLAAGVFDNFAVANGDTVTLGANQTLASIRGPVAVGPSSDNMSATVVIDDSANATPPAGPVTFSNEADFGYRISGLAPERIYLRAGQNTTLNTSLLMGAGDKTVNVQDAPRGVALTLDAGSGTNTWITPATPATSW